jgi:hypothetical protein
VGSRCAVGDSNEGATADLNSSEAHVQEVLRNLDGQKVSAIHRADHTVFEFDLGASLRLGKSIFPTDIASVLWTLSRFEGPAFDLLNNGNVARCFVPAFVGASRR